MEENVVNIINEGEENTLKKSMSKANKPVSIPCSKIVYEFTKKKLQDLGGLSISGVYHMITEGKGIVLQRDKKALQQIEELIVSVEDFKPSVPMTSNDVLKIRTFVSKWKSELVKVKKQLLHAGTPVYMQDEVAKVLKQKKSKVKFHEVMLEWYLSTFGGDNMTPENVADAVIRHDATDWTKTKPLAKDYQYNIRMADCSSEVKSSVANTVQWIYEIKAGDVDKDLASHLANDLQVMKEFAKWRDNDPKNYEYRNVVQGFINRLQTIVPETIFEGVETPQKGNDIEQKNVVTEKGTTVVELTTTSQAGTLSSDEARRESNRAKLQTYLNELTRYDSEAHRRANDAAADIEEFSQFSDFDSQFDNLKTSVASSPTPFKGGYAVGFIHNKVENQRKKATI
jgi:hypothetical protein